MRRLLAALLDVLIGFIFSFCIIFIIFMFNEDFVNKEGNDLIILLGFAAVYFMITTEYPRLDIGKKVCGVALKYEESKPEVKIYHAVLRLLCFIIWPFSIVYMGIKGSMPYDKSLGIYEEKLNKSKKEFDRYLRKRFVALLIDLVCFFVIMIPVMAIYNLNHTFVFSIVRILVPCGSLVFWILLCLIPQVDLGKKVAGLVTKYGMDKVGLRICHALLKSIGVLLWPITGAVVMITGGVPYDKWLKIEYTESEK